MYTVSSTATSRVRGDIPPCSGSSEALLHLALLCFQTGELRVVAHDCNLSYLDDKEVEAILEAIETLSQST